MENFITDAIDEDLKAGVYDKVLTRFPPEPNGYLHLGHAKSICLNFEIAKKYNGSCNLRLDDTNPSTEEVEFVDGIISDVKWLGYEPSYISYASDYFDELYEIARKMIRDGVAYVCDLHPDEVGEYRGIPTEPGEESPYRNRPPEENLILFENMKNGKYAAGAKSLRAKIDMASPNLHLRDPILYRIDFTEHYRTGKKWCIYPTYDFAHPLCDALEGITHSLCTLEFEIHRPLYNWVVDKSGLEHKPRQIEFARLNVEGTTLSKRKLANLVGLVVRSWSDARMPTLSGLRNKGISASAIRAFCDAIGIAKFNGMIDPALLDHFVRNELNKSAKRIMAVANPLTVKVPDGITGEAWIENNPEDFDAGIRGVAFSDSFLIDESDFSEDPPKGYYRLYPGNEVRLKAAGIVKCNEVKYDFARASNSIICDFDPDTAKKKVKGTIHWVNPKTAVPATVITVPPLFLDKECEVPNIVERAYTVKVEPIDLELGEIVQFMRKGYFKVVELKPLIFREVIPLKDSFNK